METEDRIGRRRAAAGALAAAALAVAARAQAANAGWRPEVPSFGELGHPGFEPAIWQAVFLPPDTPPAIAGAIEAAVRAAIASPAVSDLLRGLGFGPAGGSSTELAAMLEAERATWTAVIAETGIRPRAS
jgi:tripartite-type tricarboxylate transporter receptor subunit TctC